MISGGSGPINCHIASADARCRQWSLLACMLEYNKLNTEARPVKFNKELDNTLLCFSFLMSSGTIYGTVQTISMYSIMLRRSFTSIKG